MTNAFLTAATDALKAYKKFSAQRKDIESQLANLERIFYASLDMLTEGQRAKLLEEFEPMKVPSGLSDAVLRALDSDKPMTAVQVRDTLIENGYDLSEQVNALGSIYTTLRRLVVSKLVSCVEHKNHGRMYKRLVPIAAVSDKAPFYKRSQR